MRERGEHDPGRQPPAGKRPHGAKGGHDLREPETPTFLSHSWKTRMGWNEAGDPKGRDRHGPAGRHVPTYQEHHRGGRKR